MAEPIIMSHHTAVAAPRRRRLHIAVGACLATSLSACVAIWISPFPGDSLRQAVPVLAGVALALLILTARDGRAVEHYAGWAAVVLGLGVASLGITGMLAKPTVLLVPLQRAVLALQRAIGIDLQRLPDTFHPNVVAGTLLLLAPLAMSVALAPAGATPASRRSRQWLGGSAAALMGLVLVLTQSRGAYLGLVVAALVLLAWLRPRLALLLLPLLLLLGALGYALLGSAGLADTLLSADPAQGWSWRREVWRIGLRMAGDFPFTGIGLGQFRAVQTALYPVPLGDAANHAHNLFLQVHLDVGLVGWVGFMVLWGMAWRGSIAAARDGRGQPSAARWALGVTTTAALAGLSVHGLLDCAVWGNKAGWVLWLVLALGARMATWERR